MGSEQQASLLRQNVSPRQVTPSRFPVKDSYRLSEGSIQSAQETNQTCTLQRKTSVFGWWKYEILASAISVGSLVALVILVRHYDGRPLQDIDLPKSLQLSTIIAALSTVMRVALSMPVTSALSQDAWLWLSDSKQRSSRYGRLIDLDLTDNASRGPWGSLKFLVKARRRYIARIGAMVTILSLGLSTFTQQIVIYEISPLVHGVPNVPNISRSQSWSSAEGHQDAVVSYLNPNIKAAVNSGFFNLNIQPLPVTCPTSNCTWPATPSLAVCGGCTQNGFTMTCNDTYPGEVGGVICNYTAPSGATFQNDTGLYFSSIPGQGSVYNASDPTRLYFANWDVGGVDYLSVGWNEWNEWNSTTFLTYECALWACIQSYTATVKGSEQTTLQGTEWPTIIGIQNGTGVYDKNSTFGDPLYSSDPNEGSYTVTDIAAYELQQYMPSFFIGNATIYIYLGSRGIFYSNDFVEVIYNATINMDLDALAKNIALSMSNVFRTAEPAQDDAYNGTASALSVAARWVWLTLPIVLVALSLLSSMVNIVRTYQNESAPWKGGPLALLVCDIDPQVKATAVANMDMPGGLEKSIGNVKVVLAKNDQGGWVFENI